MSDDIETPPPAEPATVTRLPIAFKSPPGEDAPALKVVDPYDSRHGCNHKYFYVSTGGLSSRLQHVTYRIRDGETDVECGNCGTRLDPMWVLRQFAAKESEYVRKRQHAQEEMARLRERERTECQHCGKMTKISRTKASKARTGPRQG